MGSTTGGSDLLAPARGVSDRGRLATAQVRASVLAQILRTLQSDDTVTDAVTRLVEVLHRELGPSLVLLSLRARDEWAVGARVGGVDVGLGEPVQVSHEQANALLSLTDRGAPELWPWPTTEGRAALLVEAIRDSAALEALAARPPTSVVVLPLTARGRRAGALLLAPHGSAELDASSLDFLHDLAGHVSAVLDSAVAVADSRHLVATFTHSLIHPPRDPIPGLEVGVAATVADADLGIGGDFADVHGPEHDLSIVVGDAVGHGIRAAIVAKRMRSAVRTATHVDRDPSFVLGLVNRVALDEAQTFADHFTTLLCARARPEPEGAGTWRLCLAAAGHPAPWVLRKSGVLERVEVSGPPVSMRQEADFPAVSLTLDPGDTLVAITDGIAEAHGPREDFGEDRVARLLSRHAGASPADLCRHVMDAVEGFSDERRTQDDRTVLALRCVART